MSAFLRIQYLSSARETREFVAFALLPCRMRVLSVFALVGLFAFEATLGQARSSTGDRLLVLREAEAGVEEYQLFWDSLEGKTIRAFRSAS